MCEHEWMRDHARKLQCKWCLLVAPWPEFHKPNPKPNKEVHHWKVTLGPRTGWFPYIPNVEAIIDYFWEIGR